MMIFRNILLIEDNKELCQMMSEYLELKNYHCKVIDNGRDGLKTISSEKFDVVLLDLAMPEFSGYDIIDALEREGSLKKHNIIVLTASDINETRMKDLENRGVKMCLRKPIQLSILLEIVGSVSHS